MGKEGAAGQNPLNSQNLKPERLTPDYLDPGPADGAKHPLIELNQDLIDYDDSVQHLDPCDSARIPSPVFHLIKPY